MKSFRRVLVVGGAATALLGSVLVSSGSAAQSAAAVYTPASTPDVAIGHLTYSAASPAHHTLAALVNSDGSPFTTNGSSVPPLAGSTAHSAAVPDTLPWICSAYTSDPSKTVESGKQVIYGDSDQLCSGAGYSPIQTVTTVEQYRGLGIWSIKDKYGDPEEYGTDYSFASAWWTCASGTGYQKYRIIGDNYADNGTYSTSVQSLNYLSVTCPS